MERTELQEDLINLPLNKPECKVGDFGCGPGYISWCLLLEIPNSKCVGIDKFAPPSSQFELEAYYPRWDIEDNFQSWSINSVQCQNKDVVDHFNSETFEIQENDLLGDFHRTIINEGLQPIIRKGDIVTGEGFSPDFNSYFDFVYCKRLLYPIFGGEYENLNGDEGIKLAITHIANSLKPDGRFCFVEVEALCNSSNLEETLKRAGFQFEPPRKIIRPYKTLEKIYDQYWYHIYQCRKVGV